MNPNQGHKRGMSRDESIPSLMDLPKRGRFDSMGGGAMPRTSLHQNQHPSQGSQQAPVVVKYEYGTRGVVQGARGGRGGQGGGGPGGRGASGATVMSLMDLPLDNNRGGGFAGSGNPTAGLHSHSGHSSFVDNDDGCSAAPWRAGGGRGKLDLGAQGRGSRGRGSASRGRGMGHDTVPQLGRIGGESNIVGSYNQFGNNQSFKGEDRAHGGSSQRDSGQGSGAETSQSGEQGRGQGVGSMLSRLMDLSTSSDNQNQDNYNQRSEGRVKTPGRFGNNDGSQGGGRGGGVQRGRGQGVGSRLMDLSTSSGSQNQDHDNHRSEGQDWTHNSSQGRGRGGGLQRGRGQGVGSMFSRLMDPSTSSDNQNQDRDNHRSEGQDWTHNSSQGRGRGGGVQRGRGQGVGSMFSRLMDLSTSSDNQNQDRDNHRSEGQDWTRDSSRGSEQGGGVQRGCGQGVGSILSRLTDLSTSSDNQNQFGDDQRQGGTCGGFGNNDGSRGGERGRGAKRGRGQGVGSMLSRLADLSTSSETSFLDSNNASGFGQGRGRGGFGEQGRGRGGFGEQGRGRGGFGEQGRGRGGFGEQGRGRGGFGEQGRGRGGFGEQGRGRGGFGEQGRDRGGFGEQGRGGFGGQGRGGGGFGEQGRGGFGEMGRGRGGFGEMGRGRGGFGEQCRGSFGGQGRGRGGHRSQDDGFANSGNNSMGDDPGKVGKPKKKSTVSVSGRGTLMTRPNGTTYYLRYEHTLLRDSDKFLEGQNQLPILDRLQNLCELAKPLLNEMPELDEASIKFEELLLNETVCLKPTYAIKAKRLEEHQPGDPQPFEYMCKIFIENILMAADFALNKMEAKNLGCLNAIKLLATKTAQAIFDTHDMVDDVTKLGKEEADIVECPFSSAESNIGNVLSVTDYAEEKTRADFYILEPEETQQSDGMKSTRVNSAFILRQSADFSHMLLAYEFTKSEEGFLCTVKLQGETIATGSASEQHKAKNFASHGALESLRQTNWTIVARELGRPQPSKQSLHEICGRIRPHDPKSKDRFMYKLKIYLKTHLAELDDYTEWLTLPLKLNKAENDAVYELGKEMNLTVQARTPNGKRNPRMTANDPRFLVVTKKFQSRNLFDYIWEKGGETWRYKLKPPCEIGSDIQNSGY